MRKGFGEECVECLKWLAEKAMPANWRRLIVRKDEAIETDDGDSGTDDEDDGSIEDEIGVCEEVSQPSETFDQKFAEAVVTPSFCSRRFPFARTALPFCSHTFVT